jgi:hypothetical protein
MKLVIAARLIALAANTAALAQYVLDAKGRRYRCLPGDWSCTVLPPSAQVQPLRRPRPRPPKVEECGSRCDLLDRMK